MKAFVSDRYGSPDVMKLQEVDKPELTEESALVRVRATSVNAWDWHMLRGKPYLARLGEGFRAPKTTVLGLDVAGVVEAVGANVTHVKPGDRVYGSRTGAFAEYISGRNMVPMPAGVTFEQAAAVPTAAQTALVGLRDKGEIQAGQHVLINGAGGGVGTFAIQIAKALGADVTAVTSTNNVDMVRSIGADEVIDYTREDFTRSGQRYDLILDVGGNRSLSRTRRVLTPEGTLVLVAPGRGQWVGPVVRVLGAIVTTRLGRQNVRPFLAPVGRENLLFLKELIETGKLTPVIDRIFPFNEIPAAVRYSKRAASGARSSSRWKTPRLFDADSARKLGRGGSHAATAGWADPEHQPAFVGTTEECLVMPTSSARRILPFVLAYLPVPIVGAILSAVWNVGASPEGGAGDMFLSGTALTPPLFLPAILVAAAYAARGAGVAGQIGAGASALVGAAFLAGSTLNLPNDLAAAESAGSPVQLSIALAVVHIALSIALLYNAVPAALGRRGSEPQPALA